MKVNSIAIVSTLFLLFTLSTFAQRGKDNVKTNSVNNEIVNAYSALTANAPSGATLISVTNSTLNAGTSLAIPALSAGDLIMIIQMQGVSVNGFLDGIAGNPNDTAWGRITSYNSCGLYEFAQVKSVPNGTSIELDCGLTNTYTAAGKAQVVRVPRYISLTVNNSIIAAAWNGTTGGVVAIEVLNNTTIGTAGKIYADATGFRGGSIAGDNASLYGGGFFSAPDPGEGAEKGESVYGYQATYDAIGGRYSNGSIANGGGGGRCHNGGGGGGSNAGILSLWNGNGNPDNSVAGFTTAWNLEAANFSANTSSGGGRGGYSFSSANLNPTTVAPGNTTWGGDFRRNVGGKGGRPLDYNSGRIFMGGGGGAGDQDNSRSTSGANGGGIVYLMNYGTVTGSGTASISSNGGTAANTPSPAFTSGGIDGAGGGGGGGVVIVNSVGVISGIAISANGGNGGNQVVNVITTNEAEGPGGGGGGGYIAISNGTVTRNANGGNNGTTNSPPMNTRFPANGATRGGAGINNASIPNFTISANDVTVCSGSSAALTATINGTPPSGMIILWYSSATGGTPIATGTTFTTPNLTSNTTYYVGTCPGTYRVPIVVTIGSASIANAGADQTICSGNSTTLSTVNATSCSWIADPTLSNVTSCSPTATPTSNTTYYVTLTDANGCVKQDTVTVNVVNFNLNVSADTTICPGSTINLTASGGSTYNWTSVPSGTYPSNASINVTPSASTIYSVISSNGVCSRSRNVTVTVRPDYVVNISPAVASVCLGDSVLLTASNNLGSPANYSWSPSTGLSSSNGSSTYASPIANEIYTVTANINGCEKTQTVSVNVNALPSLSFSPANPTICLGSSLAINASGGISCAWTPSAALTNGNNCTAVVTPAAASYYSVTVTDINNCSKQDSVLVNVSAPFALSISNDTAICPGAIVNVSASGATTYGWSSVPVGFVSSSANNSVTPSANTTYYLSASNGICTIVDSVVVSVYPDYSFSINPTSPSVCIGDSVQLTASNSLGASATYNWSPNADLSSAIGSTVYASPTNNATYTVTSNINGCEKTQSVSVNVNSLPSVSFSPLNPTICLGASLNISASGGVSCTWQPSSSLTNINSCSASASPTVPTFYTVTIADNNGCLATDSVQINVSAPFTLSLSNDTSICSGSGINIQASGASIYTWTSIPAGFNSSSANISVTPSQSTTYYVTASNGICSLTDSVVVTIYPDYSLTINPSSASICSGDSVQFLVSNSLGVNTTYSWIPTTDLSATTGSSVYASPTNNATYAVTTNINGCEKTQTVSVNVNALPTVSFNPANPTLCAGTSLTISASGGVSCSWQNSASLSGATTCSPSVNPTTDTYYTVTVIDNNNCTNTDSVLVTIGGQLSFSLTNDTTICQGASVALNALSSLGGVSYIWSPASTLNTNSGPSVVATPTTSSVTYYVTANNGLCQGIDSVKVSWQPSFTTSINPSDPTICAGDNVQLNATNSLGVTATYNWIPAGGLSQSSGSTVIASPLINTTYQLTATINGCSQTANIDIAVTPLPSVSISPASAAICFGERVLLTASGATSYVWNPAGGLSISTGSSVFASPFNNTTYTVTGTTNGCSSSASVDISVLTRPSVSASSSAYSICLGQSANLNASSGLVTYTWASSPSGASGNSASISVFPITTTTYTVTASDGTCSDTGIVTVIVNNLPAVSVNNASICVGQSTVLTADGANSYSWSPGGGLSQTSGAAVTASPLINSSYTVTGTDLNGCSNSAISNVTVLALPVAAFTPSKSNICAGDCITFTDNSLGGVTSWTWNYGDGNISSNPQGAHCYNTPGTYTVSLNVTNGVCAASSLNNQTITVLPSANADFNITPSDSVLLLSTPLAFSNQSTGATNYLWNFGDRDTSTLFSPSHNYTVTGTYDITLIATNSNGCNDTTVRTIRLEYPKNIPNVFSPNNDGKNDLFFLQSYSVTEMQIFNRWGQLVFDTQTNTWDGKTQSGADAPAGVYYFIAVLKDNTTLKGYVSLVN